MKAFGVILLVSLLFWILFEVMRPLDPKDGPDDEW